MPVDAMTYQSPKVNAAHSSDPHPTKAPALSEQVEACNMTATDCENALHIAAVQATSRPFNTGLWF